MDVRCEKCQTEYELDEARLKPGGVTVKCTNCGHMFKIRKRTPTNVGAAPSDPRRPASHPDDDAPTRSIIADSGPTSVERQWIIRLENGEQKSCGQLATLQQWIVANTVSRESLISRTGKTWKRLGDIAELAQYFEIADEARSTRGRPTKPSNPVAGTMLGIGAPPGPTATGGTILPDDIDDAKTGRRPAIPDPTKPARTPPLGSNVATPVPTAGRRPLTTPPPPPPKKTPTGPVPVAAARPATGPVPVAPPPPVAPPIVAPPGPMPAAPSAKPSVPASERSTGVWASDPTIKQPSGAQTGPFVGKLSAIPDEPAFAGRVRVAPSDESSFDTGRVAIEDDDDMLPARRGSRAGLLILVMMLLVGAGAAAVVYVFVIDKDDRTATAPTDAPVAAIAPDASDASDAATAVVAPPLDAAEAAPSPLDAARGELAANHEARLKTALESLPKDDPATQAVRANLAAALAQAMLDRAGLVADKTEADKLRKDAKAIVLDAATAAQRAYKASPDDPGANLAMANVLRLQGKPAKEIQRYASAAETQAGPWAPDLVLARGLVLARDGKLDEAKAVLTTLDGGEGKLETTGDVRARFHLALIALAQNRAADAKTLVEQVLAAQPEHAGARALVAKLETAVASSDPLPPEDPTEPKRTGGTSTKVTPPPDVTAGGGSYDQLLARANKLAETNCTKATELFAKALEQKPNGVEALTGQGYCHIDAKQFASAFSKFRAALAVSSRYEPALWGIAEAYQQQGRREQALEAFKKYLEVYPDSAKAKKQIDRLGGGTEPASGGGSTPPPEGSAPPPPPTPPAPAPAPTPSETTGSGAG